MKNSLSYKIILLAGIIVTMGSQTSSAQFLKKLKKEVKEAAQEGVEQAATNHAVNDAGNTTDKAITKGENAVKSTVTGKNSSSNSTTNNTANNSAKVNTTAPTSVAPALPTLATYANYDFVPGDSIIFADDFSGDQVGELPAHWLLCYGQGQVNEFDSNRVFMCTAGAHGDGATVLEPRMKKKSGYMPAAFTVEFDMYVTSGSYDYGGRTGWVGLTFYGDDNPINRYDDWDLGIDHLGFYSHDLYGEDGLNLPDSIGGGNFVNKWHHVAIAYRDGQMKIYLDQNRIYVIPQVKDTNINKFGLRVSPKCVVTNIRLAEGGGMTMLQKKFTEAKIITHGITFDVDQATIKPESMGTLNMIVNILKTNQDLKFEIDGHTDNTGDSAHNMTLSQERADAVKAQLVSMGIDASRLATKGFGDSRPISDNSTPEGRANNRRVEFVRM